MSANIMITINTHYEHKYNITYNTSAVICSITYLYLMYSTAKYNNIIFKKVDDDGVSTLNTV